MPDDIFAFASSCLLILSYYLYLHRQSQLMPDASVPMLNAKIRKQWIDMIRNNDKMDILAIQTLRNSLMAANFMASTAILLIISSLNLSDKISEWALLWNPSPLSTEQASILWRIKLGLLLFDFSVAFFCFAMAVRFFNHVGYMINLPRNLTEHTLLSKQTFAYLDRAGVYYTRGTRTFFLSLPILLWFFGPIPLMLSTLILVRQLAILDRIPV